MAKLNQGSTQINFTIAITTATAIKSTLLIHILIYTYKGN